MKTPFLLLICSAVTIVAKPVDFTLLKQVPRMRAAAFLKYQRANGGDPEERGKGERAYLMDLAQIASDLRQAYYARSFVPDGYQETLQVPDDFLATIEKMARLLENLGYPKNVAAGTGLFYERDVFYRQVQVTEAVILSMTKAIVRESWDWDAPGSPPTPFDYKAWLAEWDAAAKEIRPRLLFE